MRPARPAWLLVLAAALALGACDAAGPDVLPPADITLSSLPGGLAPGQTVQVRATVRDAEGGAVAGATVDWTATGGTVEPASSSTDGQGVARTDWTLGSGDGGQTLTARVGQLEASATVQIITPCQPDGAGITLAPGESVALTGSDARCNALTEPGRYVISVFNASTAAGSTTGFRLRGSTAAASAAVRDPDPHAWPGKSLATAEIDASSFAHLRLLEANRRLGRELAARLVARDAPRIRAMRTAEVSVGDTRSFRIPDLDAPTISCNAFHTVTARAAYVGDAGVIWEDTAAPLTGTMDDDWARLGREVDEVMVPLLREYFGDPLLFNDALSGSGQVAMLFSRRVDDFEGNTAGFVFTGDFFPSSDCAASDQTEVFYAGVPSVAGSGFQGDTVDRFMWSRRSTVIHELKHIVSFARKIHDAVEANRQPQFEVTWLEEATAQMAEEFYARSLFGYGQGENVGYAESLHCEVRPGPDRPDCSHLPDVTPMQGHFGALNSYLRNIEDRTPIGSAGEGDFSFYGSGWLLVRWAMDHSGVPERDFSRALVEATTIGVGNLTARAGRTLPAMLGDFSLALAVDGHPSGTVPARAELTHPGWNLRDIYRGLHADFGDRAGTPYSSPWPLSPRSLSGGAFESQVQGVRGGSAALFDLAGAVASQTLELRSSTGGTAPSSLGLSIVRIE